MTSGVPQWSVLGPILFIIYINDQEVGLKSTLSKFADDTEVGGKVLLTANCEIIHRDLDLIIQWSEKWKMSFNTTKCKVTHIGSRNSNHTYYMDGELLQTMEEEKVLWININSDLKHAKHCKSAYKEANTMLGFTVRNFEYETPGAMLTL